MERGLGEQDTGKIPQRHDAGICGNEDERELK